MLTFRGTSDIKRFVKDYLLERNDLGGKVVIDIPAGKGYTSGLLTDRGAVVQAYDLFPEFFRVPGVTCHEADLTQALPVNSASADMVICQEGIEHIPDQLAMLREFNRVLRDGGSLVITTPSISHLRARLSHLLCESELYSRMPPNELDAVWHADNGKTYFGHIFLIGIQRLRVLAVAAGFDLVKVHPVRASGTSLLLAWLYPFIALTNLWSYWRNLRKRDSIDPAEKRRVYGEILRLNLHPTILFGRHLFIEFRKRNADGARDLFVNERA